MGDENASSLLSQDDINRLLNEATDTDESAGDEDAPSLQSTGEPHTPANETGEDGTFSQEELDRLLSEVVEIPEAGELQPAEPEDAQPSDAAAPTPSDTEPELTIDESENTGEDDEDEEIRLLSDEDLDDLILEEVDTPAAAGQDNSDGHDAPAPEDGNRSDIKADLEPEPEEPSTAELSTTEKSEPLDTGSLETDGHLSPMLELPAKKPGKFRMVSLAVILVCTLSGLGGWFFLQPGSVIRERLFPKATHAEETPSSPSLPEEAPAVTAVPEKTERPQPEISPQNDMLGNLPEVFAGPVAQAESVRQALLAKQQELENLRGYYRRGIDQIKASLLSEIPSPEKISYSVISENRKVMLDLRTIQRRRAYISHLDTISAELQSASEELLYLKRQTAINTIVGPVTSGLDNRSLAAYLLSISQIHAADLENKAFDVAPEGHKPLSKIWADIQAAHQKQTAVLNGAAPPSTHVKKQGPELNADRDSQISNAICSGDLSKKYMLRRLTENTARCLAGWRGKDLVLNGLTEMTPQAAKRLSQWQGDWLCLNGFTELSPESAAYLFRWEGKRLSLNGLSRLSPRISEYIVGWPGKQLELTGLTDLPFEVATGLIKWQEKGGTIYVPEKFRGAKP